MAPEPAPPRNRLRRARIVQTDRYGTGNGAGLRDPDDMGLNPFRPVRRRSSDYLFVAAAVAVVVALLAWAAL